MKIITHWLFLSFVWIAFCVAGCSLYIKYDWEKTLQNHQTELREFKLRAKEFKLRFRRAPSPNVMWHFKYVTENTKNAFSTDEFKCLQDENACASLNREQLCERLQSFPNINDCKSILRMRDEFIRVNQYMDQLKLPTKPKIEKYIQSQRNWLIVFAFTILIPPVAIFILRRK